MSSGSAKSSGSPAGSPAGVGEKNTQAAFAAFQAALKDPHQPAGKHAPVIAGAGFPATRRSLRADELNLASSVAAEGAAAKGEVGAASPSSSPSRGLPQPPPQFQAPEAAKVADRLVTSALTTAMARVSPPSSPANQAALRSSNTSSNTSSAPAPMRAANAGSAPPSGSPTRGGPPKPPPQFQAPEAAKVADRLVTSALMTAIARASPPSSPASSRVAGSPIAGTPGRAGFLTAGDAVARPAPSPLPPPPPPPGGLGRVAAAAPRRTLRAEDLAFAAAPATSAAPRRALKNALAASESTLWTPGDKSSSESGSESEEVVQVLDASKGDSARKLSLTSALMTRKPSPGSPTREVNTSTRASHTRPAPAPVPSPAPRVTVDVALTSQLQQQRQQQQLEQPQSRHTSHGTFVVPRSPDASRARGEEEHAVPLSLLIVLNAFVGAYGLIQVSMFLLVLPRQCEVMFAGDQAVGLAALLGMAGVTQLVNPVAGLLSDRTASPFGRRRPFVVVGSVVAVAALCVLWYLSTNSVLVAAQDDLVAASAKGSAAALAAAGFASRDDFDAALDATRALYVAAFVLLNVSLNVCFAAYAGLIPDFVPVEQLGEASGIMAVMNALGALVGVWLVGRCGVEPFSLFAFCVVLCCALTLVTVKEHPLARAPAPLACADVFRLYFEPLREPAFRAVWFSRLLYYMGISIQVFMQFFIRDALHVSEAVAKEETALVSIVMLACASLVAVPCGLLSDRVGRRPLVYTSCTLMSWTYVGWSAVSDFDQILWLAALFGLANGCFVSVEFAIGCDTLPDKDEHAAQALGIWGIAAFLGTTLGPVLAGPVLFLTGTSDQPDVYTRSGYTCLLAIGAILVLGSALALRAVPEFPHGGRHADVAYRALSGGDKLWADSASP